jgi:hypothetical protein
MRLRRVCDFSKLFGGLYAGTRNGSRNLHLDTTYREFRTSPYSLAVAFSSSKPVWWMPIR